MSYSIGHKSRAHFYIRILVRNGFIESISIYRFEFDVGYFYKLMRARAHAKHTARNKIVLRRRDEIARELSDCWRRYGGTAR